MGTVTVGLRGNRNWVRLWTGQAIALVGFYAFNITVVLWVGAVVAAGESWAPVAVSGVLICAVAPVLVVGPIAGVYVDRWDRRRTMMATDLIRALLAASLVPLSIMDDSVPVAGELVWIYVVVVATSACRHGSKAKEAWMLALIRHARTVEDPARPAEDWVLDPSVEEEMASLRAARDWDAVPLWLSSTETKAVRTAELLTSRPVTTLAGLREVRRGGWTVDYDETVARLFADPEAAPADGWESARSAVTRFHRTIRPFLSPGVDVAVVSHGLVMTLWCAALRNRPVDLQDWRSLRFPDLLVLSDEGVERLLAGATAGINIVKCLN